MPLLIAVAGLPGAGKSRYVHQQAREHGLTAFSDVTQDGWCAWGEVRRALADGRDVIVDSATFTTEEGRAELFKLVRKLPLAVHVEWRYFACDPSACLTNILRDVKDRPGREFQGRLKSFLCRASCYVVPEGAIVLPVYQGAGDFRVEYRPA